MMDQERNSLEKMGAFEEVELPKGKRTISLKWVYVVMGRGNPGVSSG